MNNFKVEDFKPVNQNIILQPGPIVKIKTLQPEPVEYSPVQKGNEATTVKKTVKKYEKEPTKMRIGKILAISDSLKNNDYTEGDWVIYNDSVRNRIKLDLLTTKSDDDNCPIIVQYFEILSKVNYE